MGLDKPQTKTIAGHVWVVTPFPGRPANKYKARILKMVGPAIAELLPALGSIPAVLKGDVDEMAMISAIPKLAAQLTRHVDEDVLVDTMVELMALSIRDGTTMTPEQFDIVFAGNDLELYQVLWFIIQVNYPDFIGWVGSLTTGLRPKDSAPETPEKPQPSSATSK